MYRTGRSAQCDVAPWMGRELRGEEIHVFVCFAVHLKLSQPCSLAVSQFSSAQSLSRVQLFAIRKHKKFYKSQSVVSIQKAFTGGQSWQKSGRGDFLGGPVVKTLPSSAGRTGLIPGRAARVPHASWPKKPKT